MTSTAFYTPDSSTFEREVEVGESVTFEQIWGKEQKELCIKWIKENLYEKVCLQFPDGYLIHSTKISDELKNTTSTKCFILADTSYGSCCVDEIAAAHVSADSIIHFGNACKSKVSRLPVLYIFPNMPFNWDDLLTKIQENFSKEDEVFAHFDIPYLYLLDNKYQTEIEKIKPHLNKFCTGDSFPKSGAIQSEVEPICLFIGQDNQSFFNLSASTKANKWYIYDPLQNTLEEIRPTATNWIKRRYFYIEKCKDAQTLGIIIATLTADGYLDVVDHIKQMAKGRGIKTYIISVGRINPAKLANFIEIDCFVLIGCPFNNLHNSRDFFKPIVSVFEAEMALNPAWRFKIPEKYSTDFNDVLPGGDIHCTFNVDDIEENDVSLLTGKMRNVEIKNEYNANSNGVITERQNYQLMSNGSMNYEDRSWKGLEPALGLTEPAKLEQGLSGIPINYQ